MSFPRPSKTDMGEQNTKGFTAELATAQQNTHPYIVSGADLLKNKAVGKLNENRSTSVRKSYKDKD